MDRTYHTKDYGDVIIKDSDPDWVKQRWLQIIGAAPVFVPSFRLAFGTDGIQTWNLNQEYFASMETAEFIAKKFGNGEVYEVPFGGSGGLFAASAKEYHVEVKPGVRVNAGILAAFYKRNPEDQFPGLAEKLIRAAIETL